MKFYIYYGECPDVNTFDEFLAGVAAKGSENYFLYRDCLKEAIEASKVFDELEKSILILALYGTHETIISKIYYPEGQLTPEEAINYIVRLTREFFTAWFDESSKS